jgi:ankyrin repeat protein
MVPARGVWNRLLGVCLAFGLALTGFGAAAPDLRLVQAVKAQDKDAARALLKQHPNVNATEPDGATALHWAVHWEDLDLVDLLIKAGANVNLANDLGTTPLFMASSQGNAAIVTRLVGAGANPNTGIPSGMTALMAAARMGSMPAVEALLARGADPNVAEPSHGQTALMWAVANRFPHVVRVLLEYGADVTARTGTRRMILNMGGNRSAGNATKDTPVAEVEVGGSTPLLFAARQGDLESAKLLIDWGANISDQEPDGTTALVMAVHSGNGPVAMYLLDKGADPNAANTGYTALHAAVLRADLVDPLVELGFVKEKEREYRARDHSAGLTVIKALLAHGANPNARITKATPVRRWSQDFAFIDRWIGATPFWLAAKFLELDMMRALVAGGADPKIASDDGTTPLMAAAGMGYRRASGTEAFIKDRRDFSYYNNDTSDIAARIPGDEQKLTVETVKLVVELGGGDINATSKSGDTALHAAASLGLDGVVQLLAERGAKLDVKNKGGQTPLDMTMSQPAAGAQAGSEVIFKSTADLLRQLASKSQ